MMPAFRRGRRVMRNQIGSVIHLRLLQGRISAPRWPSVSMRTHSPLAHELKDAVFYFARTDEPYSWEFGPKVPMFGMGDCN